MRHFLFEDKAYGIRPTFSARRDKRDSAQELAKLLRRFSGKHSGGNSGNGNNRHNDARQNCVSKMQYSDNIAAHKVQLEKYLTREGTERDGTHAKLFGSDINEYKEKMVDKNFRIFLSPGSDKVDCKKLANDFVKRLEASTGYKLLWQGAVHYNTAHPHAHLLINGVDKNGIEVEFSRDIVKTFFRENARDICTAQIGNRTKYEMRLDNERSLTSPRYTKVDKQIENLCYGSSSPVLAGIKDDGQIRIRLEHLRKLGLATWQDGGYRMADGWSEALKANGRYNVFLEKRAEYGTQLKLYSAAAGPLQGKVVNLFRTSGDASDDHAAIVKTKTGETYFVPFYKQPEVWDNKEKHLLHEGEDIRLKVHENARGRLSPLIFADTKRTQEKIITDNYQGRING